MFRCQGLRHQVMAMGLRKVGHVQEMAGLKLQQVGLMGSRTGWRPESEENEVSLR